MKNIENNTIPQVNDKNEDQILHLKIAKVIAAIALFIFACNGVKAMFTDITYENLEREFKDAQFGYQKADDEVQDKFEQYQLAVIEKRKKADNYCNKWKNFKGYKESKEIKLEDPTLNICIQVKAPQEGF